MELSAPADGPATATVVEASMGQSGPQATVIVRSGRLRVGDPILVGTEYGKVREGRRGENMTWIFLVALAPPPAMAKGAVRRRRRAREDAAWCSGGGRDCGGGSSVQAAG